MRRIGNKIGICIINSHLGEQSSCPYFSPCYRDKDICEHIGAREERDMAGQVTKVGAVMRCKLQRSDE